MLINVFITRGVTVLGVLYPGYRRSLGTANKSGYGRFPPVANGWGTISPILDTVPQLLVEEEGPPTVIPRSKETELKLPYVCLGSHITRTVTHRGKTDAMFDYLIRVLFSYINDQGVSKKNTEPQIAVH
jgi:hypothetical protein